jgi:CBS domain containing-hemolysin-like protein
MITPSQIVGDLFRFSPEEGSWADKIRAVGKDHFLVSGSTDLEDLSHEAGIILRQGYNSTLGGFICERLGVIPEEGQRYEEGGYVFVIKSADGRLVREIEVFRKPHG